MINFKKPAMIIGHPGHELRAFKFMKDYQPDIYIMTDGSGSTNSSRINTTINIIESLGCRFINLFDPYTDKAIYKLIYEQKISEINLFKNLIAEKIKSEKYDLIIGDALEGFNPTHDLCRYIINSIVKEYCSDGKNEMLNYAFDLDSTPDMSGNLIQEKETLCLLLSEEDLEFKFKAAFNYSELKFEVEKSLKLYGKEAFRSEFYTKVNDTTIINNWGESAPKYESVGKERVKSGLYSEVIEFEKHMKPIALNLLGV